MASQHVHYRFPRTLVDRLTKEANKTGRTRSEIVRSAINEALNNPRGRRAST
jgi:predicted DNA-binding protein